MRVGERSSGVANPHGAASAELVREEFMTYKVKSPLPFPEPGELCVPLRREPSSSWYNAEDDTTQLLSVLVGLGLTSLS